MIGALNDEFIMGCTFKKFVRKEILASSRKRQALLEKNL